MADVADRTAVAVTARMLVRVNIQHGSGLKPRETGQQKQQQDASVDGPGLIQ